jgi:hypothetical protein
MSLNKLPQAVLSDILAEDLFYSVQTLHNSRMSLFGSIVRFHGSILSFHSSMVSLNGSEFIVNLLSSQFFTLMLGSGSGYLK